MVVGLTSPVELKQNKGGCEAALFLSPILYRARSGKSAQATGDGDT